MKVSGERAKENSKQHLITQPKITGPHSSSEAPEFSVKRTVSGPRCMCRPRRDDRSVQASQLDVLTVSARPPVALCRRLVRRAIAARGRFGRSGLRLLLKRLVGRLTILGFLPLSRARSPDVGSDVSMKIGYVHIFDDVFRPLYKERH